MRAVLWAAAFLSPPFHKLLSKMPEIELVAIADIAGHTIAWVWKRVRNAKREEGVQPESR